MQSSLQRLQRHGGRFPPSSHRAATRVRAARSSSQIQLLHPIKLDDANERPLLVFLPGTDGTGQAILPQLPGLVAAGFDVRTLYMPPADRSSWPELTARAAELIEAALAPRAPRHRAATLVGESFGGCLALRVALAAPQLLRALVLLNPATCFAGSLGGLSGAVAGTRLLSLFPRELYTTAQSVMMPLLVDRERIGKAGAEAMARMMLMEPPRDADGLFAGADFSSSSNGNGNGGGGGGGFGSSSSSSSSSSSNGFSSSDGFGSSIGLPPPFGQLPGGFAPAAAADHRAGLLRAGDLPDAQLARVAVPQTLIVCSACDRMLPSLTEGARLQRAIPGARRVILPNSGHAALLERGVSLARILADAALVPGLGGEGGAPPAAAAAATAGRATDGQGASTAIGSSTITSSSSSSSSNGAAANGHSSSSSSVGGGAGASISLASADSDFDYGSDGSRAPSPSAPLTDPSDAWMVWGQRLAPWRELVAPVMVGAERLPDPSRGAAGRPVLFVGNHQRMGLYDTPLLLYELYLRGFKPRGLAHPDHWRGPLGDFFESFGAVKASPMAAFKLLKGGEHVLLFPGGAAEVNKPRGREYTLSWPDDRPDFVRLAGRAGAIVVPVSAVGADDAYDVLLDVDEMLATPVLGPLAEAALARFAPGLDPREGLLPVTRLPGAGALPVPSPIPLPNLQRLYFRVGTPVDTAALGLDAGDMAGWQRVYDSVRGDVEAGIAELLELRAADSDRDVGARVGRAVASWAGAIGAGGGGGGGGGGSSNGV